MTKNEKFEVYQETLIMLGYFYNTGIPGGMKTLLDKIGDFSREIRNENPKISKQAYKKLLTNRHDNPYKNLEDFEVATVHYQTELVSSLELCYNTSTRKESE